MNFENFPVVWLLVIMTIVSIVLYGATQYSGRNKNTLQFLLLISELCKSDEGRCDEIAVLLENRTINK